MQTGKATTRTQRINDNTRHYKREIVCGISNTTHNAKFQSQIGRIGNTLGKDPRNDQTTGKHKGIGRLLAMRRFKKIIGCFCQRRKEKERHARRDDQDPLPNCYIQIGNFNYPTKRDCLNCCRLWLLPQPDNYLHSKLALLPGTAYAQE